MTDPRRIETAHSYDILSTFFRSPRTPRSGAEPLKPEDANKTVKITYQCGDCEREGPVFISILLAFFRRSSDIFTLEPRINMTGSLSHRQRLNRYSYTCDLKTILSSGIANKALLHRPRSLHRYHSSNIIHHPFDHSSITVDHSSITE